MAAADGTASGSETGHAAPVVVARLIGGRDGHSIANHWSGGFRKCLGLGRRFGVIDRVQICHGAYGPGLACSSVTGNGSACLWMVPPFPRDPDQGTPPYPQACTDWYGGFFRIDPATEDRVRRRNPQQVAYGLCAPAWLTALVVFAVATICLVILQLVVGIGCYVLLFLAPKADKLE